MTRKLLILLIIPLFLACNKENQKAKIPAYLHIDKFNIDAEFASEGTSNENLTTVWVELDGENLGAYELPASIPIIETGKRRFKFHPGMNLNGISGYRTPYPFYVPYEEELDLVPDQTHYLNQSDDSIPILKYGNYNSLNIIEDFESIGFGLEVSQNSDTTIDKINNSESFAFKNEPTNSGKVVLKPGRFFEARSTDSYILPRFGADVYVELNYKTEVPFTVGVYINLPNQAPIAAPVVTVNPKDDWNKIYINLVTEVSAYSSAIDHRIFIATLNSSSQTKSMWIDNFKLIY